MKRLVDRILEMDPMTLIITGCFLIGFSLIAAACVTWPDSVRALVTTFLP